MHGKDAVRPFGKLSDMEKNKNTQIPAGELNPETIIDRIGNSLFATNIVYYTKTESTNSIAMELAVKGAPEGTLVLAEEQSGGKGRMGRKWLSPAFKNILMSFILKPDLHPSRMFLLTMLTSLGIVKAVEHIAHIKAMIKWPNDIYIENKKAGGILTELKADHDIIHFAAIGIGLNVNFDPSIYPEIRDTATSLSEAASKYIIRVDLLAGILSEIEALYRMLKKNKGDWIFREWRKHCMIIGREVRILGFNEVYDGVVEDIDEYGALLLRGIDGKLNRILNGDVSLRF